MSFALALTRAWALSAIALVLACSSGLDAASDADGPPIKLVDAGLHLPVVRDASLVWVVPPVESSASDAGESGAADCGAPDASYPSHEAPAPSPRAHSDSF